MDQRHQYVQIAHVISDLLRVSSGVRGQCWALNYFLHYINVSMLLAFILFADDIMSVESPERISCSVDY